MQCGGITEILTGKGLESVVNLEVEVVDEMGMRQTWASPCPLCPAARST